MLLAFLIAKKRAASKERESRFKQKLKEDVNLCIK